jgi:hypothetical protein
MTIAQGNIMFFGKDEEFVSVYSVLSAWETEGNQVAFFDPSQDGYFTHSTVPGDRAGGQILGVFVLQFDIQVIPP